MNRRDTVKDPWFLVIIFNWKCHGIWWITDNNRRFCWKWTEYWMMITLFKMCVLCVCVCEMCKLVWDEDRNALSLDWFQWYIMNTKKFFFGFTVQALHCCLGRHQICPETDRLMMVFVVVFFFLNFTTVSTLNATNDTMFCVRFVTVVLDASRSNNVRCFSVECPKKKKIDKYNILRHFGSVVQLVCYESITINVSLSHAQFKY